MSAMKKSRQEGIGYQQKLPDFMSLVNSDHANKSINGMYFMQHVLCAKNCLCIPYTV